MSDNLARRAEEAQEQKKLQDVYKQIQSDYPGLTEQEYQQMLNKWHFRMTGWSWITGVLSLACLAILKDEFSWITLLITIGAIIAFVKFSWVRKYDPHHNIRNL